MEKMNGLSLDMDAVNIAAIKELFPTAVTEGRIDFEMLRSLLGGSVDDSKEKYMFSWNGKIQSIKTAQAPSSTTLRPNKSKSINWDNTGNLYIEGDNLEVLKQLQKTYFGKIRMIYIDPPYNTGSDFVYKDNFIDSIESYKEQTNQESSSNPNTSGRFHSDWLNMMYPRLILARNLLSEDGAIFISIDDHELNNLTRICNEVFGENNFAGLMTILSNPRGSQNTDGLSFVHEYILMYCKDLDMANIKGVDKDESSLAEYSLQDDNGKYRLLGLRKRGGAWKKEDRPMMHYPIYVNPHNGECSLKKDAEFTIEVIPARPTGELSRWTWGKEKFENERHLLVGKPVNRVGEDEAWDIFRKDYLLNSDGGEKTTRLKTMWLEKEINYQNAKNEIKELFGDSEMFDFPKPTYIVNRLMSIICDDDSYVLDFFSGSGTTAHAVMNYNLKHGANNKFILVQLPELFKEKNVAYKAGYRNICELGEERLRRAGQKIKDTWQKVKEEEGLLANNNEFSTDVGFKVFELDSTNINPWDNTRELDEQTIFETSSIFKLDRTDSDVLYEIMLKYGVFDQPISEVEVNGKTMYRVGQRHMIVCLEDKVDDSDITEICKLEPRVVVFKEDGFKDDNAKINAEYNLKKAGIEDVKCI